MTDRSVTATDRPAGFPLAAVVGYDDAKLALLLSAVEPRLGGVLLRGDKGTAKSTLARGLAALLPTAPFVELPLGATEDRVVGAVDVGAALDGGGWRLHPGLLARADGGVLYVDEVNLLAGHLVDVLLDAAASGTGRVERDGLSQAYPARFVLVGSMNPEEGELRPQLLDRFGLVADLGGHTDVEARADAVRRRLAHDADPEAFAAAWAPATARLHEDLARAATADTDLDDAVVRTASALCCELGVGTLRADLTLCRAAAALARLQGDRTVTDSHLERVAALALAHRRRRGPFDRGHLDADEVHEALDRVRRPAPTPEGGEAAPGERPDADRTTADGRAPGDHPGDGPAAGPGAGRRAGDDGAGMGPHRSPVPGSDGAGDTARRSDPDTDDPSSAGPTHDRSVTSDPRHSGADGRSPTDGVTVARDDRSVTGDPARPGTGRHAIADGATSEVARDDRSVTGVPRRPDAGGPGADDGGDDDRIEERSTALPGDVAALHLDHLPLGRGLPADGAARRGTAGRGPSPGPGPRQLGRPEPGHASGPVVGARPPRDPARPDGLAPAATVLAGVARRAGDPDGPVLARADLREPVRRPVTARTLVVGLDTSASMGADARIGAAREALLGLLLGAYQRRERVALVAIGGETPRVVLQPTSSVEVARARLARLAPAGPTPLAAGIAAVAEIALRARADGDDALVVLITDGRATAAPAGEPPFAAALAAADAVAGHGLATVVLDAESGPGGLDLVAPLAARLGARHLRLAALTADHVELAIRTAAPAIG
jgi:magnesium chelatase subunit D